MFSARNGILFVFLFLFVFSGINHAHHGPGGAGGGLSTRSADTLAPGVFTMDLRFDYTRFEKVSDAEIESKALAIADHFHAIRASRLETLSFDYGATENLQLGLSLGYYGAFGSREGEYDATGPSAEVLSQNPDGFTDLWLQGKWRFEHGPAGSFALLGAAKIPVGRRHVLNSDFEEVEFGETPSTAAYDFSLGLAWTRWVGESSAIDVSLNYILRGEHQDFQLGDRIEAGFAFSERIFGNHDSFPRVSLFGEMNFVHLMKNDEGGHEDENSGGTALYLSPGIKAEFSKSLGISVAPQFPVLQSLHGEQVETRFKMIAALTWSF